MKKSLWNESINDLGRVIWHLLGSNNLGAWSRTRNKKTYKTIYSDPNDEG